MNNSPPSSPVVCCDSILLGFKWLDEGSAVSFHWLAHGPAPDHEMRECEFVATWVDGLTINLGNNVCTPLTWDCHYNRTEDDRWKVLFDFAGDGDIRFNCNEYSVRWLDS